jgi:hypothetical protein
MQHALSNLNPSVRVMLTMNTLTQMSVHSILRSNNYCQNTFNNVY